MRSDMKSNRLNVNNDMLKWAQDEATYSLNVRIAFGVLSGIVLVFGIFVCLYISTPLVCEFTLQTEELLR